MKKIGTLIAIIVVLIIALRLGLFAYQKYQNRIVQPGIEKIAEQNILILYYSDGDKTKSVVESLHNTVGGEMIEIKAAVPYPKDKTALTARINTERDDLSKAAIDIKTPEFRKYNVIFIAAPFMEGMLPPVVERFVRDNEERFNKKVVAPIIVLNKNQSANKIFEFYMYRFLNASAKASFLADETKKPDEIAKEIEQWLKTMDFRNNELK